MEDGGRSDHVDSPCTVRGRRARDRVRSCRRVSGRGPVGPLEPPDRPARAIRPVGAVGSAVGVRSGSRAPRSRGVPVAGDAGRRPPPGRGRSRRNRAPGSPSFLRDRALPPCPPPPSPSRRSRARRRSSSRTGRSGASTRADFDEFNRAWTLFVRKDRGWPAARDAWVVRGGAAPVRPRREPPPVLPERHGLRLARGHLSRRGGRARVRRGGGRLLRQPPDPRHVAAQRAGRRRPDATGHARSSGSGRTTTSRASTSTIILASIGEPAVATALLRAVPRRAAAVGAPLRARRARPHRHRRRGGRDRAPSSRRRTGRIAATQRRRWASRSTSRRTRARGHRSSGRRPTPTSSSARRRRRRSTGRTKSEF